mgnify:FL=1|tara:strand:- start:1186 stop:1308 length:123 start_codon:yes stop_codon:yes gene_type:complete
MHLLIGIACGASIFYYFYLMANFLDLKSIKKHKRRMRRKR